MTCDISQFFRDYCLSSIDSRADPTSGDSEVVIGGIVLEILLFVVGFKVIAVLSEEFMSPAFESLSLRKGGFGEVFTSVLISATLSIPETALSLVSAIKGEYSVNHSLAISTILGSGWLTLLVIPALASFRHRVSITTVVFAREAIFYVILCLYLQRVLRDDSVSTKESLGFLGFYGLYFVSVSMTQVIERQLRREHRETRLMVQLAPIQMAIDEGEMLDRLPLEMAVSHELSTNPVSAALISESTGPLPHSIPGGLAGGLYAQIPADEDGFVQPLTARKDSIWALVLSKVCVRALPGTDSERFYAVSLVNVFFLELFFSSIVAAVCNRWISFVHVSGEFIGPFVVAFFSQLTEIMRALTVSSPAAAGHIITASLAAQVFAVAVGLGLPWLVNGLARGSTEIDSAAVRMNVKTSLVASTILAIYSIIHVRGDKIQFNRSYVLLVAYVVVAVAFIVLSLV